MPVYEYQCKACHQEFEYQQRMSDPDKTTCETCGGDLDRLISRTAFALKGNGWYKDLYSSQKPAASCAPEACAPAAGGCEPACGPAPSASSGGCGPSGCGPAVS
ncbi:MAG TPA: zinc ribbon domain-containing protein [Kofleriaceae bacterium]|nr:zinc ribbon domain-containing protein [Kofleriaceae bacterium]